ncbi:aminoglycoside phosphotransferase family protein [Solwaraspora sp. WMMD406]|uniref:phosphotransferase n=1 Tax=Solwaraspora sp. WMMD406 TaxID=3016095 RepID=UPI0024174BC3|nr:aminoglycoside phosphotransferase family protein [Solwaraspora sp. WMMD406]MDG4766187.1 aminoglycoside phosphotransferase family protein [Solwaraspora sp. WMMD406]
MPTDHDDTARQAYPGGDAATEQPLTGGNVAAAVVRVGDTVRRPAGEWTPAVHAYLTHLHDVGFDGAPRPLGIDDAGREVLTYVPGTVPWPDRFDLLGSDAAVRRVGRLLRDLHDAAAGFTPPPNARWRRLVPPDGTDLVVHHDPAAWNLVVGDRWAFIDWDTAAPGTRLWDLAYTAKSVVPLTADPAWQPTDPGRRLRVLADGYGLDERQRRALVPLLTRRARSMYEFLAARAAVGAAPWTRLWREGHGAVWRDDAAYIRAREHRWAGALLG